MKWKFSKKAAVLHRVKPEKDWKHLLVFAVVMVLIAVVAGSSLWFYLIKIPEVETSITRTPTTSVKDDDITDIVEYMEQRQNKFTELQRSPVRLVDPSLGR